MHLQLGCIASLCFNSSLLPPPPVAHGMPSSDHTFLCVNLCKASPYSSDPLNSVLFDLGFPASQNPNLFLLQMLIVVMLMWLVQCPFDTAICYLLYCNLFIFLLQTKYLFIAIYLFLRLWLDCKLFGGKACWMVSEFPIAPSTFLPIS